jgi:membrane associated rhomboid family serine protease
MDIWHAFSNMLWLSTFGYILQSLTGNKKIIPLYIYGGLVGAIIYVVAFNTLPPLKHISSSSILLGASASVMAIAMTTTTLAPNYRIFPLISGGIPLWVLTLIFALIDIASISASNTGVHLSHIGRRANRICICMAIEKRK